MKYQYLNLEKVIGRALILGMSILLLPGKAQAAPTFLYQMSPEEFAQALDNNRINEAEDISALKSFLDERHGTSLQSAEELKNIITREDFDEYCKNLNLRIDARTGSPTCIC